MARHNLFFRSIGVLHPEQKTPAVALVVQAVWTSLLCLSGTYSELLNYVIFAALLFYMLTAVGLFMLRARRPDAERPVRAGGKPWLPAPYVLGTGVLCVNPLFPQTRYARVGLIIVALGIPVYFPWRRFTAQTAER